MLTLLLLNGPPGVGKSTLAQKWARAGAAREWLDPDEMRARVPGPATQQAMIAARDSTLLIAEEALRSGTSVVVSQLCARAEFPDRLRELAAQHDTAYVEVMLLDSHEHLHRRLHERARSQSDRGTLGADALDDEALRQYRSSLVQRAAADPEIVVVECPQDQEAITLRAIEQLTGP